MKPGPKKPTDDEDGASHSVYSDLLGGLLVLFLTLGLFVPAVDDIYIDPRDAGFSARDFPIGVLFLLVLLSCVMLVGAVYRWLNHRKNRRWDYSPQTASFFRHVIPMLGIGYGYAWLVGMFQYLLPTVLATAGAMAVYGNRGVWRLLVVPVMVSVFYYLLFFGVLGLYEQPGTILAYDHQAVFSPLRTTLMVLFTW